MHFSRLCLSAQIENIIETINSMLLLSLSPSLTLYVGHRRVKSCHFRLFQSAEEISSPYFSNTFTKPKRKKINLILLIFFLGFFSSFKLQKLRVLWRRLGGGLCDFSGVKAWLVLRLGWAGLALPCPALAALGCWATRANKSSHLLKYESPGRA